MAFKVYWILFAFKVATCSCRVDRKNHDLDRASSQIKKIATLPPAVDESSGLALGPEGTLWTHNDSGGDPILYRITPEGRLVEKRTLPVPNQDWEDIASGPGETLFVGDVGNNLQMRKNLVIWKVDPRLPPQGIFFSYADQRTFPESTPNFDCEAFFWYRDTLYLFSKDRSVKNTQTKLYALPDQPGTYFLSPQDSFKLDAQVTAADISPDGKHFALLTYGKVLIFEIKDQKITFDHPKMCFRTGRKQTEALVFTDPQTLLISNEQGHLYRLKLDPKKAEKL